MKQTLVDILLEVKKEEEKYFRNYLEYAKKIKQISQKRIRSVQVYLFGSVVKGNAKPESDIDLLIVAPFLHWKKESQLRGEIAKKIGFLNPFEIHIVTPEVYEGWYKKFIKNDFIEV